MKAALIPICTVLGLAGIHLSHSPMTEIEKYGLQKFVSELEHSILENTSDEASLRLIMESVDTVFRTSANKAERIREPASRRTM